MTETILKIDKNSFWQNLKNLWNYLYRLDIVWYGKEEKRKFSVPFILFLLVLICIPWASLVCLIIAVIFGSKLELERK